MTAKDKAKYLIDKMEVDVNDYDSNYPRYSLRQARECALVCVDEMMQMLPFPNDEWYEERKSFLEEVKQEILKQ